MGGGGERVAAWLDPLTHRSGSYRKLPPVLAAVGRAGQTPRPQLELRAPGLPLLLSGDSLDGGALPAVDSGALSSRDNG